MGMPPIEKKHELTHSIIVRNMVADNGLERGVGVQESGVRSGNSACFFKAYLKSHPERSEGYNWRYYFAYIFPFSPRFFASLRMTNLFLE
jgi:hypothetical protein